VCPGEVVCRLLQFRPEGLSACCMLTTLYVHLAVRPMCVVSSAAVILIVLGYPGTAKPIPFIKDPIHYILSQCCSLLSKYITNKYKHARKYKHAHAHTNMHTRMHAHTFAQKNTLTGHTHEPVACVCRSPTPAAGPPSPAGGPPVPHMPGPQLKVRAAFPVYLC